MMATVQLVTMIIFLKLREYQQGQRDSIKSANEAKKSLVAYVKQGLDAQNDALSDAIDKKKKLLETEKD